MHDLIRKSRHVVLSGGGFKGFAYIGAFLELRKLGIDWGAGMPKLESITGCSIGALFSAAIALGFSAPEMEEALSQVNLHSAVTLEFSPSALSLDSGYGLRSILETLIERKAKRTITLKELNTRLRIAVADLEAQELRLLDAKSAPDLPLIDALMASMALPPIYPPVEIQGHLCADGGLLNFFPLKEVCEDDVIGLRLVSTNDAAIRADLSASSFPIATYLKHIYNLATVPFLNSVWQTLPDDLRRRTITIETPDVNLVEFGLRGGDPRAEIVKAGQKAIRELELEH